MTKSLSIQAGKELRGLLPWWCAIVVTILALGQIAYLGTLLPIRSRDALDLALGVYVLGSVALGALSIGHEYSHRALPMLLTQPVSRARVLAIKLGVLAVLLAVLGAIGVWQLWSDSLMWRRPLAVQTFLLLPPLGALFLTPWLTMVSRGPLAGAIFSIAAPFVVSMISVQTHAHGQDAASFAIASTFALVAAGGVLTWWSFLRLQAIDGPSAEVGVPVILRRFVPSDAWSSARTLRARNPIRMLIRKELRLQQMTFVVTGLYIASWMAVLTARRAFPGVVVAEFEVVGEIHGVLVALLAGAMVSAEERQLGTADWQTLLPVAGRTQWAVKVATAVGLALLLAVGLPAILAVITARVDSVGLGYLSVDEGWPIAIVALCLGAIYVSSLNSSGMRAFLASFPVVALTVLAGGVILYPVGNGASDFFGAIASRWTPFSGLDYRGLTRLMIFLSFVPGLGGLSLLLMRFAYLNHRSADRSAAKIRQQIEWIVAFAIAGVLVLTCVNAFLEAGIKR